jgi:hypothetical protein
MRILFCDMTLPHRIIGCRLESNAVIFKRLECRIVPFKRRGPINDVTSHPI